MPDLKGTLRKLLNFTAVERSSALVIENTNSAPICWPNGLVIPIPPFFKYTFKEFDAFIKHLEIAEFRNYAEIFFFVC